MPQNISKKISKILQSFVSKSNLKEFLTEDDLRCHLFSYMQKNLINQKNISINTEIRWYGEKQYGKKPLKFRSDIVVIDKSTLDNPIDPTFDVHSKGYGFSDYYAVIELKLRRPNDKKSNTAYQKIIKADKVKLNKIKKCTSGKNHPFYCLIVFDKKEKTKCSYTAFYGTRDDELVFNENRI